MKIRTLASLRTLLLEGKRRGLVAIRKNEKGLALHLDGAGQAMVEFAIAFPLLLIFILGILQITLIINAHSIVNYAAFYACRSGIVHNANDQQIKLAASTACASIEHNPVLSYLKTSVKKEFVQTSSTVPASVLKVTVTYQYKLIFPIVNRIFSLIWIMGQVQKMGTVPTAVLRQQDMGTVPIFFGTVPIRATCMMRMEK